MQQSYLITFPREWVAEWELIIRAVIYYLFNSGDLAVRQKDSGNQCQPDPVLLLSPLIRGQVGGELEEEEGEGRRRKKCGEGRRETERDKEGERQRERKRLRGRKLRRESERESYIRVFAPPS